MLENVIFTISVQPPAEATCTSVDTRSEEVKPLESVTVNRHVYVPFVDASIPVRVALALVGLVMLAELTPEGWLTTLQE